MTEKEIEQEILRQLEIDYNSSHNIKIFDGCKNLYRIRTGKKYENELRKFVLSPKTEFEEFKVKLYEFIETHK